MTSETHPTAPGRRYGYVGGIPGGQPVPVTFVVVTDAGAIEGTLTLPMPPGATVASRVEIHVRGEIVASIPLYAHGVPLHTICTRLDDEEGVLVVERGP